MTEKNIPWVEKYRPVKFDNIILDPMNRILFKNIIEKQYFPNLLFYGPPGTGKTTTIINLINEFQEKHNKKQKGSVIHLNASDERGIDIIRNQIYQFVRSKSLFETTYKFVILDEVDYMTKNAQQALKYLLQTSTYNVRFCLICNYISKIDELLQHEFICVRFNQLPKEEIYPFIRYVCEKENISLTHKSIEIIQKMFNSDIRSMINYIQLNQNIHLLDENIIDYSIWEELHGYLLQNEDNIDNIIIFINNISMKYNMDKKQIIQSYFNYVIRKSFTKTQMPKENTRFFKLVENITHIHDINSQYIIKYFVYQIKNHYKTISPTVSEETILSGVLL
jgi:DNA polymerase III delta prime subunit